MQANIAVWRPFSVLAAACVVGACGGGEGDGEETDTTTPTPVVSPAEATAPVATADPPIAHRCGTMVSHGVIVPCP